MGVSLLCVGKLRERYFMDAAAEYLKRLSRLMPVTLVEVPDESEPSKPSLALEKQMMRKEGERLLARLDKETYVIALCIEGKQPSSEELAQRIQHFFANGTSKVAFVVGGSLGLHDVVLQRANERMSMSRLTLPHQLARVVLLEQLFRAAKINAGEKYHK